jgi:hypothetical protein
MSTSVKPKPKNRVGRPFAGGRDPFVGIRLPKDMLAAIEDYRVANGLPSRSEAIRRMIEQVLHKKRS